MAEYAAPLKDMQFVLEHVVGLDQVNTLPGWEDASRWLGRVPFASMPRETNPDAGYFVTANNAVAGAGGGVFVSRAVSDFFRAERVHELLESSRAHTAEDLAGFQNDTVSVAARRWSELLAARGPYRGAAELARRCLTGWDDVCIETATSSCALSC